MLSFNIKPNTILLLRELTKKLTKTQIVIESLEAEEQEYIQRNALISNIGASTRIENAVLTNSEIEWIDTALTKGGLTTSFASQREAIQDKLSKDKERSIDEVVGCRSMLQLIFQQASSLFPLTEVTLRGLHKELLKYHAPDDYHSGGYKQVPNSVVRKVKISGHPVKEYPVLTTTQPGLETEEAMTALVDWYNKTLKDHPWSIAVAVEFVFRFLAIHPFQDGNGRLGRGLFYLALLQSTDDSLSGTIPYLPIDRYIEKEREEYYAVLSRCSDGKFMADPTKYDYNHFLNFMLKVIDRSIDDVEFYREKFEHLKSLSKSETAVLTCFKEQPEIRLQANNIVSSTALARPTVNKVLRVLLKYKFIQKYGRSADIRYQLLF